MSTADTAYDKVLELEALLRCAMVAEENTTSGVDEKGTAAVLRIALRMAGEIVNLTDPIVGETAQALRNTKEAN